MWKFGNKNDIEIKNVYFNKTSENDKRQNNNQFNVNKYLLFIQNYLRVKLLSYMYLKHLYVHQIECV